MVVTMEVIMGVIMEVIMDQMEVTMSSVAQLGVNSPWAKSLELVIIQRDTETLLYEVMQTMLYKVKDNFL